LRRGLDLFDVGDALADRIMVDVVLTIIGVVLACAIAVLCE